MVNSTQHGRVIAGRFRLLSELGKGGMGSVYRAEHLTLGSEVAIKLIDESVVKNPEIRARFVREAQAAAQLRSPHVVQIIDYGVDDETPFIAMELMVGESLAERLERVGSLSLAETSLIVTEVSRALSKAHEAGIVHRDLKPDNIFLVHNDDTEVAKVLDFGVAKKTAYGTEAASMTSTGAVLGTPYYMSPEQAEGLKELDHRTDIWALAVIAYECAVGRRPFESETLGGLFLAICTRDKPTPSLTNPRLPASFDRWFAQGTERDLSLRFQTARDAAQALRDALTELPAQGGVTQIRGAAFQTAPGPHATGVAKKASANEVGHEVKAPGSERPLTTEGASALSSNAPTDTPALDAALPLNQGLFVKWSRPALGAAAASALTLVFGLVWAFGSADAQPDVAGPETTPTNASDNTAELPAPPIPADPAGPSQPAPEGASAPDEKPIDDADKEKRAKSPPPARVPRAPIHQVTPRATHPVPAKTAAPTTAPAADTAPSKPPSDPLPDLGI